MVHFTVAGTDNPRMGLKLGSVCSGVGGLDLGVMSAIHCDLLWHAENNAYASKVLEHHWPDVPNLGDLQEVDWTSVEPVDVLTAGFPCQDVSAAGYGKGVKEGTRSGIWHTIIDGICVLRPSFVVVENVAALRWRGRGFDTVLGGLAALGYDTWWTSVRASEVGAPHRRERVFLLAADMRGEGLEGPYASCAPGRTGVAVGAATDTERGELQRHRNNGVVAGAEATEPGEGDQRERDGHAPFDGAEIGVAADTARDGRHERRPEPARFERGSDAPLGDGADRWGKYASAIQRWELILGRPAPDPLMTSPRTGNPCLRPHFSEWMMGFPSGWVTDVDGTRVQQLTAIGNGVVPLQAEYALRTLLAQMSEANACLPQAAGPAGEAARS